MDRIKQLPQWSLYGLLIYMPFHVFLVQSLSLITGGLTVWKIAKDVITALIVTVIVLLVICIVKNKSQQQAFYRYLLPSIFYLLLHLLLWAVNPDIYRPGAILGTVYNNRLIWYLLIGMGTALLWPKGINQSRVIRIVLIVSTAVCALGILQYFLPKDLLTHFGYSLARGVRPSFFIDDKPNLPRIMSTLRDPNSLGAFLILPITLLVYKFIHVEQKRRLLVTGLLVLHGLTLLLTFSRSAWLGTMLSIGVLAAYELKAKLRPWFSRYWPLAVGAIILLAGLTFIFRNQYAVKNILVHADKSTAAKSKNDSNGYHLEFAKKGLQGIWHKPLGHGPGTAGIVSIQNPKGGLLTENYYIQIGYEVGLLGLLVFIVINVMVYRGLLRQRSSLAICLLASFWGYVLVNMLLHIWSNEAVAAQWWLLAGFAIGLPLLATGKQRT